MRKNKWLKPKDGDEDENGMKNEVVNWSIYFLSFSPGVTKCPNGGDMPASLSVSISVVALFLSIILFCFIFTPHHRYYYHYRTPSDVTLNSRLQAANQIKSNQQLSSCSSHAPSHPPSKAPSSFSSITSYLLQSKRSKSSSISFKRVRRHSRSRRIIFILYKPSRPFSIGSFFPNRVSLSFLAFTSD